ncbi:hypothetical protein H4R19_001723 [Coemansia spiralis]|nr:hypothetical protein H4R19_001723 [Coemansia spiralis]
MAGLDPAWRQCGWCLLTGICVIGASIGSGRSGVVCSGTYNGARAAFKCCLATEGEIASELTEEVSTYSRLLDIQGKGVPRLYGHGLLVARGTPYAILIMEFVVDRIRRIGGEDRDTAIIRQCLPAARKAAMEVLAAVHVRGACHGDARAQNILFEEDPDCEGTLRPRIIDFSLGKVDPEPEEITEDRRHWRRVLYLDDAHR